MKKSIFAIFGLGLLLASCDMDKNAPGSLTDTEAVETIDDVKGFRNNVYSSMRALCSGTYVTNTELEMDQFNQLLDAGGRGSRQATANINPSSSEITEPYQECYSVMKNINFALDHADDMINKYTDLMNNASNENDKAGYAEDIYTLHRYNGELHFFRAYIYFWLFDHYCQAYNADKADEPGLGLQLVTAYDPTGDTSKYPGRSTMNEAIKLIKDDLKTAYDEIKSYETNVDGAAAQLLAPNVPYVSSLCVAAMQARVNLCTRDFEGAIAKSQEVINSGKFPLATYDEDEYYYMWADDEGSELIWVPFVDANESAYVGSMMDAWAYYANYPIRVDFAPSAATLNAYGTSNSQRRHDIRFESFFSNRTTRDPMQINAQAITGYIFNKWPGNPALISGTDYLKNKPKPFRTSEQYLILAEASAELGLDAQGLKALNDLRKARIDNYSDASYSGQALINAVREERAKELIGEGFRMSDLRRWGLGFTRDGSNPGSTSMMGVFVQSNLNVAFTPGDYRYVWPIPYDEMQITPALAGQQNPGYN